MEGASNVVGSEVENATDAEVSEAVEELITGSLGATDRLLVITRLPVPFVETVTNIPLP
jgi:hypothetical protein